MKILWKESERGSGKAVLFPYVWIEEEFRKRKLFPPGREEIQRWADRSASADDLLEDLYRNLHVRVVSRALAELGINRKNLHPELFSSIVERAGRGIIDLPGPEIVNRVKTALAALVSERLYGQSDPVSIYLLLTNPPFSLFILSWSDAKIESSLRSSKILGQIATGLERLMHSQGGSFQKTTSLQLFRQARALLKAEKKRRLDSEKAQRERDKAYRFWIRSLWSAQDVRRSLSIRPCELEDWVKDGRIPVAIRIEFRKWGQTQEKRLFDPEVIGAFTWKMVQAWREEREQKKREKRKKRPGIPKKNGDTDRMDPKKRPD